MKTLHFSIQINAPKATVWNALWEDPHYRQWTAVFQEGSYAESDWHEGSKIRFLAPDGSGMYALIDKKIPNEQMTFRHLGEIKDGVEQPQDWQGALESYHLSENEGVTTLNVEMHTIEEYEQMFKDTFPKALEAVKRIAEQ